MKKEAIVQVNSEIITNQEEINKYEYHLVMMDVEREKTKKKIEELKERRETLLNCL
ncbi:MULTISPECIES: hypothetical protein [Bacillus cereus group]|uniref:hypothetical protein n=1 Tax=Bacillus cereus group TaxID=86661 RepID=UPI0014824045|nr:MULTISPECIES: hypothetical protein [Bacillus cereus group]MCP1399255.1 putative nucleic acid-binding Zn-ribbon protein [Bacillus cereus]